jgi:hypothetical protein
LLLTLVDGTVAATLDAAASGTAIEIPTVVAAGALIVLVGGVVARIAWVLLPGRGGGSPSQSGPAVAESGAAH